MTNPTSESAKQAYDKIDRFLRNNLDDTDYADFSAALDLVYADAAPQPQASPQEPSQEPVAGIVGYGVFGWFPDSGGWCLQTRGLFINPDSDKARHDCLHYIGLNLENDGDWQAFPLYASPQPQAPSANSEK